MRRRRAPGEPDRRSMPADAAGAAWRHGVPAGASLCLMLVALLLASARLPLTHALITDVRTVPAALAADRLDPPGGLRCGAALLACSGTLGGRPSLSWTVSPDAYTDGYIILRSTTSGGPYAAVGSVGPTTTTFTDGTTLSPLTTYRYVVVASSAGWTSVPSNEVAITILLGA